MTIKPTNTDLPVYQDLINYFSSNSSAEPAPIAHPDRSVNKMVNGKQQTFRKAAVLIPITRHESGSESHIVLTVRSENLKSHAGQISLPGGTSEAEDPDAVATALRECEEEIGLKTEHVEIIGQLGDLALPSGFHVTPVVGLIQTGLSFTPCPVEVADIFQAPLELLLDTSAYTHSTMVFNEVPRKILELQYQHYRIWGATAAILYHLAKEVEKHRE